jgi:hypothetical protein
MKLSQYKTESYEFTKQTSDLVRQFAFAGIAIVWIFRGEKTTDHLIPEELIDPIFYLVVTLVFDFFQYLTPSIIWTSFFLFYEKKNAGNVDVDITASWLWSVPGIICFVCKVITLVISYYYILNFLIARVR